MLAKILLYAGTALAMFLVPVATVIDDEFPVYRVVVDPGHGGINVDPVEKYGDRYDLISKKYLEVFREGSAYGGLEESVLMYDISVKVAALLKKTETDEGWLEFRDMLGKYSSEEPKRIIIKGFLSRKESRSRDELQKRKDPNVDYRLFDFPDQGGRIQPGRISYINSLKPQLVVSLHCAQSAPSDQIGMSAVIAPPYSFMKKGLDVMKGEISGNSFFYNSPYDNWFEEKSHSTLYHWFLSDSSMYFTGYPLTRSNDININRFKGYRQNMVTWAYADAPGWENDALSHPEKSRYAADHKGFIAEGKYWEREKSVFEGYRRDGGMEGYGGDNYYASNEIIRYMLSALAESGYTHNDLRLAQPYLSVWSVPLYVNAVSAYVELGYLKMPSYQKMFREKQDIVAEGIAAGIYSLLAGSDAGKVSFRYKPKGKKLDLEKYKISSSETYFEAVAK